MSKDNFETRVSANYGCRTIEQSDNQVQDRFSTLVVVSDCVFDELNIGNNNVLGTGGKFNVSTNTIPAGTILTAPQGTVFTIVTLLSGMVIGYYAAE